jgi:hypothetical protein
VPTPLQEVHFELAEVIETDKRLQKRKCSKLCKHNQMANNLSKSKWRQKVEDIKDIRKVEKEDAK